MKFKPGQSGNPGGRPKAIAEVQKLARECTPEAFETLRTVMRNKKASDAARVAAADKILDRGWGKALQANVVATMTERDNRSLEELSTEELLARFDQLITNVESELAGEKPVEQMSDAELERHIRLCDSREQLSTAEGRDNKEKTNV